MTIQERAAALRKALDFAAPEFWEIYIENALQEVGGALLVPPRWLEVAGDLLEEAGCTFAKNVCNDWLWPEDWSREERVALVTAMVAANLRCNPDQFTKEDQEEVARMVEGRYGPPDWWAMKFLGRNLREGVT